MDTNTMQSFDQSFTALSEDDYLLSNLDSDNMFLDSFHQYPQGDFRPTFYNPFEIKHRRRTTREQLGVLEASFSENPKPSATIRRILAQQLDMTPRGIQIWFQNRRAKAKLLRKKTCIKSETSSIQYEDEEDEGEYSKSDLSQSSVLFSQFFANMPVQDNPFLSNSMKDIKMENGNWPSMRMHQSLGDHARSLASVAAASAVASSPLNFDSTIYNLGGHNQWLHMNSSESVRNDLYEQQANGLRRKSCPIPNNELNNLYYDKYSTNNTCSSSMLPQSMKYMDSREPCIQPGNTYKRSFSYDSNLPIKQSMPLKYYSNQDMSLAYAQSPSIPSLSASCSSSTVAGSPLSLNSLYIDNAYYNNNTASSGSSTSKHSNNNSRMSSPLSAQPLTTDVHFA
ncbi:homeobox domain-containing protein [Pilobolus umbonatus]|nr:homeobox domain-containing protein [Pilobolus umbonatus]